MVAFKKLKLGDLCTKITDGSHYSPKGVSEGYPMLSVQDMTDFGFDYSKCKYISQIEYDNMKRNGCVPLKNDVLIAKDGSYLKHVFVINEEKEQAILSSIGILRPDTSKVFPIFLKYFLQVEDIKRQCGNNYVTGSVLKRIILKNN